MTRSTSIVTRTVALLLAPTATSCASSQLELAVAEPSGIVIPEHRSGVLQIRNGCAYLTSGNMRSLIVWPHGTSISADGRSIMTGRQKLRRNGEPLKFSGGDISIEAFPRTSISYKVMKRCGGPYILASDLPGG